MAKVSILDISVADIRDIEVAVGARMTDWPQGVPSLADLYARIYAAGTGTPLTEVERMTLRELSASVALAEDESAGPDPT
jgi:hypothetical protein